MHLCYGSYIRILLCATILAFVTGTCLLNAATETDKKLQQLRSVFDNSLKKSEKKCTAMTEGWPQQYLDTLKAHQEKLQREGNLEGWSALNKEIKRFGNSRTISQKDMESAPKFIQAIQNRFHNVEKTAEMEKCKEVLELRDKYVAYLTRMKTSLTKQNQIESALKVNTEIKRINKSAAVMTAEFMSAESAASGSSGSTEAAPPETTEPKTPAVKQPIEPQKTASGVIVYPAGKHPPPDKNKVYKRLALSRTARSSLSGGVSVSCWKDSKVSSSTQRSSSYYSSYSYKTRSTSDNHRLRLAIRTTQSELKFPEIHVYTEFYVKPRQTGRGRVNPSRARSNHVKLANVGKSSIYIDLPTFSASSRTSSGYYSNSTSGSEYYGCVVSVFDPDGKFLYQGASASQLRDHARTSAPNLNKEEIRMAYEQAKTEYYSARSAYYASPQDKAVLSSYHKARDTYYAARAEYDNISSE